MFEPFVNAEPHYETLVFLTIVSSLFFIIQAVMLIVGYDLDTSLAGGHDLDVDGFHLVSCKTIASFLVGFSWTGLLFWDDFENKLYLALGAFAVGTAFMLLIVLLLKAVLKLDRDETFNIKSVIGEVAEVYMKIPSILADYNRGKVMVSYKGTMHEIDAISDEEDALEVGTKVKIVGYLNDSTLIVTKDLNSDFRYNTKD